MQKAHTQLRREIAPETDGHIEETPAGVFFFFFIKGAAGTQRAGGLKEADEVDLLLRGVPAVLRSLDLIR